MSVDIYMLYKTIKLQKTSKFKIELILKTTAAKR